MNVIFLSYRRKDMDDPCDKIYQKLVSRFGNYTIYKDTYVIGIGVRFDEHILEHLKETAVFIPIIGPHWADERDENKNLRLFLPNDMVHVEILTAIQERIPIIPVFYETNVPPADALPADIQTLRKWNGVFVHESSFENDMATLITAVSQFLPSDIDYRLCIQDGAKALLPPLIRIPAGPFTMGDDANDSEKPTHQVTLPDYYMAAHPVTVEEYALFMEAIKHAPPLNTNNVYWTTQLKHKDHPVVNVTWHDVVAYAAWLSELTGQAWHLPSEAQWEKAARGPDDRIYPWGNEWNPNKANTNEGGKHTTTPIKSYPKGKSSYGVWDMSGNVWEWTASLHQPYDKDAHKRYDDLQASGSRVRRGGSWSDDHTFATASRRLSNNPNFSQPNLGFRLALG